MRRAPRLCGPAGPVERGGRSASFRPSAFPGQARKRVSLASFWSCRAWPPYHSGSCSLAVSGRGPYGALARWCGYACSPRFLREQAAGAGGRALLRPPSRAPRSRRGKGGPSPLPRGGGGRRPGGLRAGRGRWGGGLRRGPPAFPLEGGPRFPTLPPLLPLARSPKACAFGRGRGAAPCAGCGSPGGGGGDGRPVNRSPGGPVRPKPSLRPPRVGNVAGVTGDALAIGGAAPILLWFVAACRRRAWSARHSGALVRARPSAATPGRAGGGGRCGVRRAGPATSPPPRRGRFWGRGGVASAPGGRRVGRSCGPQVGGGSRGGGGRGGRSAAPRPPARSNVCLPSFVSGTSPQGILVLRGSPGGRGRWARAGLPPVGQCSGGGGRGGVISSPWFPPLPSTGLPLCGPPRLRRPGRLRSVVGW